MKNLIDSQGNRKYLTAEERNRFEDAARAVAEIEIRTFCLMLKNTGCRISEALNLKVRNIDFATQAVIFETLKQGKNKRGQPKRIFRQVPISDSFLDELNLVHKLKPQQANKKTAEDLIWNISRATASRNVDLVMQAAQIIGVHATPTGLRHGFGVACIEQNIPLNILQKWLGHAHMTTTAIYANLLGKEERSLAERLWNKK